MPIDSISLPHFTALSRPQTQGGSGGSSAENGGSAPVPLIIVDNGRNGAASAAGDSGTDGLATLYDSKGRGVRLAPGDAFAKLDERMRLATQTRDDMAARYQHHFKRDAALRQTFDLPSLESEKGGGLMLTGDITKVIDRWMANDGVPAPKAQDVRTLERDDRGDLHTSKRGDGTSMITLFLPGEDGRNDPNEKVEILFNNETLKKLAGRSTQEVKAGLIDMLAGGKRAGAANEAMDKGTFGAFFDENADRHPEFRDTNARFAFVDPSDRSGHPSLMIQSNQRPEYVRENLDEIVESVMSILHGAYPKA